jgi:hypothetical protein
MWYCYIASGADCIENGAGSMENTMSYMQQPPLIALLFRRQPLCHMAPSLRLLVPSSLQAYHHFFTKGTCL